MTLIDYLINSNISALWLVFIVQFFMARFFLYDPLVFYHELVKQTASKASIIALKRKKNTPFITLVQIKSLTLFFLLWLTPIVFALAIDQFVLFPALYHLVLLMLIVNFGYTRNFSQILTKVLTSSQKLTCRELLKVQLNRDTENLSELGLIKASIELLIAQYLRGSICIIFFYCTFGIFGALTYRLLSIIVHKWRTNGFHTQRDRSFPNRLLSLFEWVPLTLFASVLFLIRANKLSFTELTQQKKSWRAPNIGHILAIVGGQLNMAIGGAVSYEKQRFARPQLGTKEQPTAQAIPLLCRHFNLSLLFWLVILSLFSLVLSSLY